MMFWLPPSIRANLAALLLPLLLAACAASSPPRDTGTSGAGPAVSVEAPRILEGFDLVGRNATGDEEIGTQLRYRSHALADLVLDVFAYVVGFTDDGEAVLTDFEAGFEDYMRVAKAQGSYDSFRVLQQGRLPVDYVFGRREGSWSLFTASAAGQELLSITYLFYRPPFAVKLRASHPPNITPMILRGHTDTFALQLLPELQIRRTRGCDAPVAVNVDTAATREQITSAPGNAALLSGMQGCTDYDLLKMQTEQAADEASKELTPP